MDSIGAWIMIVIVCISMVALIVGVLLQCFGYRCNRGSAYESDPEC